MSFKNKTVIVTGASRGIGHAIAKRFAQEGANLAICSTNEAVAQKTAKSLADAHAIQAHGAGVDIANQSEVDAFIHDVVDRFGQLDVLVNNAGITRDNLLLRLDPSDWDAVIHTNLTSIFHTTKTAIKWMLKKKYGRIINMASVVGVIGNPGQSNYAASKAGMIGFTKSVAKEYGKKNITVNAIAPGFIETDMIESLPNDYLDNIIKGIPMARLGMPDDVANAVMFLASDHANYITGQVLSIDGGLSM